MLCLTRNLILISFKNIINKYNYFNISKSNLKGKVYTPQFMKSLAKVTKIQLKVIFFKNRKKKMESKINCTSTDFRM